ncbi:MAG: ankyrin repeat domain-containing protein [Candidatus Limnocylindria bacterium]
MTDIFAAVKEGDRDEVARILARDSAAAGARDPDGVSVLLTAVYHGKDDIADLLLAQGRELDVFEASAVGDTARVRELVDADPSLASAYSPDGFFPLGLAAFFKHPNAIRELIAAGADVRAVARNPMQVTALHSAVANGGDRESALALIAAGADVNAQQRHGWTALHGAAEMGDREVVEALLAAGADASVPTRDGKTAAELAREQGSEELAAAFEGSSRLRGAEELTPGA